MTDKRYIRQTIMEEIKEEGQNKILNSKALVVGAGGLGSPVIYYLSAAGIGTLGIVDNDTVSESNLNRQILHTEMDLGINKTDSAENKIKRLNSNIMINKYDIKVNKNNIDNIVKEYDIVIDCVDNIKTRYIVNDSCHRLSKPLVEGGIMGFDGFIMTILPGKTACFRCVYPEFSDNKEETIPVLGATAGVIGSMQVIEAIKIITNNKNVLENKIIFIDLLTISFDKIDISRNEDCITCGS